MNRAITLEDGKQYLEVAYRIQDFRKDYGFGRIETKILHMTNQSILIKAQVFNKNVLLAEAHGMRRYSEIDPYFTEIAETVAIGRALSDIGYNLFSMQMKGNKPTSFAIPLDDGKKYLNVGYRVAWFHRDNPEAIIRKEILQMESNYAVAKVTVQTKDGIVLTTAHARRDFRDNSDGGEYFLESAETAAVGRAMTNLGYDLPPSENAERFENKAFADMPIGTNPYANMPPKTTSAFGMHGAYPTVPNTNNAFFTNR